MHTDDLRIIEARPIACPRRLIDRRTVRTMVEVTVAAALALPVEELGAKTRRTAPVAFARQISMYCAHVTFGWSLTEAGAIFNRDRTTAAHACRVVEDRRDDAATDRLIGSIETALQAWLATVESCRGMELRSAA
jgi:chromosomal replication initiation ATPase DnaA